MADTRLVAMSGNPIRRFVNDHPMVAFVVFSYLFSWMTIPILGGPIGTGPFLAAIVVLSLTQGRPGVRSLWRQMIQWRVNWRWYALAILLPIVTAVSSAIIAVALGAETPASDQVATWVEIPINFVLYLLIPLWGPWEEPGFRGFALTRLTRTQSILMASMVIAVIHVFWHAPLFFTGEIPASDVVWIFAASIVFSFLVIRSGGSVLLAMVMHATNNVVSGEYVTSLFSGDDVVLQGWVRAIMWTAIAIVVVLVAGRSFTTKPQGEMSTVEPALGSV
ncbi:MAG TPA: type II CAAX endopeptidase family protein [Acidimicrobiia bacterium]|jgi:membrane protease YdiL (CAAX protease family)